MIFSKLLELFMPKGKDTKQANKRKSSVTSTRIGELGEYKINIQLDQLPKDCKYQSDLLLPNPKAKSGYSQIDHVIITPYGLFIVETKNYNGEIKGNRSDRSGQ